MNHALFAAFALAASAPFVTSLEPGNTSDTPAANPSLPAPVVPAPTIPTPTEPTPTPAAPAPAPTPAATSSPAAAQPIPAPVVSPLALDPRTAGAALKQPATATPANNPALTNVVAEAIKRKLDRVAAAKANSSSELPGSPADAPAYNTPRIDTTAGGMPNNTPIIPGAAPEPGMMTGGTRVMMGSPTDGSPASIRVVPSANSNSAQAAPANGNPLAPTTDPMETGASLPAASEPGPKHNLLDIFVGTWDVTANFDTGPGQPPETASGQMVNAWQLDGRWLKQEYSGQMASLGSFRGLGYLGYDNLQKTYVGTWMDTLSTSCFVSKGAFDDKQAIFTLTGDFAVEGGEKYKQKQVMTILSPDRYVVTMYLTGPDGVEFKTGNLEYTRAARRVSVAPAK